MSSAKSAISLLSDICILSSWQKTYIRINRTEKVTLCSDLFKASHHPLNALSAQNSFHVQLGFLPQRPSFVHLGNPDIGNLNSLGSVIGHLRFQVNITRLLKNPQISAYGSLIHEQQFGQFRDRDGGVPGNIGQHAELGYLESARFQTLVILPGDNTSSFPNQRTQAWVLRSFHPFHPLVSRIGSI